jgi:murein DD-endopeptidase MepM/ murein hydrolase activator NlpD
MDEQLHIIVAGDRGKVFKLPFTRKKLCIIITTSAVALLILTITSICSLSFYMRNSKISSELVTLQERLHRSNELLARQDRLTAEQRFELGLKVARLERNIKEVTTVADEKESLFATAIDELKERSEIIEKIFHSVGIKLPLHKENEAKNSGGLFIEQPAEEIDELLFKADKYLNTIRHLPLGKPVSGPITSRFGKRRDPLNHRSAFHTGIDIRGNKGDRIYATADGVVAKACRNGGYGNYVLIDHGNGYTSSFSHMQKYAVRKGDRVERGQLIGFVGNSGRSTGPHLHYEIALNNKPINPHKFYKVASLAKVFTAASSEKK